MVRSPSYRLLDVLAARAIRLVIVAQEGARAPVSSLLHLGGQGSRKAVADDAAALGIAGVGQDQDAVADGSDDLSAAGLLLRLGEVGEQVAVEGGGLEDLAHGLVVAAGQHDDVEGVEGEGRVGPGEGMAHLVAGGHLLVGGDDVLLGAQQLLREPLQHLLVALGGLAGLGRELDGVVGALEHGVGHGGFCIVGEKKIKDGEICQNKISYRYLRSRITAGTKPSRPIYSWGKPR